MHSIDSEAVFVFDSMTAFWFFFFCPVFIVAAMHPSSDSVYAQWTCGFLTFICPRSEHRWPHCSVFSDLHARRIIIITPSCCMANWLPVIRLQSISLTLNKTCILIRIILDSGYFDALTKLDTIFHFRASWLTVLMRPIWLNKLKRFICQFFNFRMDFCFGYAYFTRQLFWYVDIRALNG